MKVHPDFTQNRGDIKTTKMIEYGVISILFVAAVIVNFVTIGTSLSTLFTQVASYLTG